MPPFSKGRCPGVHTGAEGFRGEQNDFPLDFGESVLHTANLPVSLFG